MTDAETPPVDDAASNPSENTKESPAKGTSNRSSAIWMGTAVGIGSAALVAALMYAKRRK